MGRKLVKIYFVAESPRPSEPSIEHFRLGF